MEQEYFAGKIVKVEIESDLQDSDITFIDNMEKIKKKNGKSLSFNTSLSETLKTCTVNESPSKEPNKSFDESQSLLTIKKKHSKLLQGEEKIQSQSFLSGVNQGHSETSTSFFTEDSEGSSPRKVKKKKLKKENSLNDSKKSIELFSQAIFKQPSSEDSEATPLLPNLLNSEEIETWDETTNESHKSKKRKSSLISKDVVVTKKMKKHSFKVFLSDTFTTDSEGFVNSTPKKKKEKDNDSSSLNDSSLLSENGDSLSSLHYSINVSDFKDSDSEIIEKKSETKNDQVNGSDKENSLKKEEDSILVDGESGCENGMKSPKKEEKQFLNGRQNGDEIDKKVDTLELEEILNGDELSSNDKDILTQSPEQLKTAVLENLRIKIDFEVSAIHEICNRASKPTPEQKRLVQAKGLTIKNGKFSKEEDKLIKANWQKFLQSYALPDNPQMFFSLDRKYISVQGKQNFLWFLAQNLPDRTPYSVYRRFKVLFCHLKSGRFSAEEDKYIEDTLNSIGSSRVCISEMAQVLHRIPSSVEKRVMRLKNAYSRKIKWRKANAASFIKYLLRVTSLTEDEVIKLKDRPLSSTEWDKLSRKLDGVPVRILKRAWLEKIHPVLFIPNKTCDLRQIKLALVKMLYENNERDWSTVNWNHYAWHFEGLTSLRIYTLLKGLVNRRVPERKRSNLRKCLKVLKNLKEDDIRKHKIQKIVYQNGKVVKFID